MGRGHAGPAASRFRGQRRRLSIVFLLGFIGVTLAYFVWSRAAHTPTPDASSSVDWGVPPINAAATLGFPEDVPQTVEGYHDEILAVGRFLVEALPEHAEAHTQMALACLATGKEAEALESWKRALKCNPDYATAHLGAATLYADRGDDEQAVASLRIAIDADAKLEQAYQQLCEILLRQGKIDEARPVAEECVRRFPATPRNHFWLGQAYLECGMYAEARRSHEQAVRLDPTCTESYYSLSLACVRLGDKEQALEYRQKFATLKASDREADRAVNKAYDDPAERRAATVKRHVLAGSLMLQRDQPREAEAHWLRAGAIDTSDVATREALAKLYEQQGRAGAEVQLLNELIELEPENVDHLLRKGQLLYQLESWPDAEQAFEQVVALSPDSVDAHGRLAQIHLRRGLKLEKAVQHAEEAARLSPSCATLALVGAIREQLGDHRGARTALEEALRLDPGNTEVRQVYEQLRDKK